MHEKCSPWSPSANSLGEDIAANIGVTNMAVEPTPVPFDEDEEDEPGLVDVKNFILETLSL
jgi:hypothetical protein